MNVKVNKGQADDFLSDAEKELADVAAKAQMKKVIKQAQQKRRRALSRAKEKKVFTVVDNKYKEKGLDKLSARGSKEDLYRNYNLAKSYIDSPTSSLSFINNLGTMEQRNLVTNMGDYFERAYKTNRIDKIRMRVAHDVLERLSDLSEVENVQIEDLDIAQLYRDFGGQFMFAAIDFTRGMKSRDLRALDFESRNYRDEIDAISREIYEQVASMRAESDSIIERMNDEFDANW